MEHQHGNEHKGTDHGNAKPSCCAQLAHMRRILK